MWNNGFCNFGTAFGSGHWPIGWIFPFLFWSLIVYVTIRIIQKIFGSPQPKQKDEALDILKKRYAAGEIDQKDFEEMKVTLERNL